MHSTPGYQKMSNVLQNKYQLPILLVFLLVLALNATVHAAKSIPLQAGPVSMIFEPDNAFLRYVNLGSHEILRGINAPIRNQFWGTVQPEVSNLKLTKQGRGFTLDFDANCSEREIDFRWHGTIKGSSDGSIELTFDGLAHSDFLRNRIGFCVLHGPSAAGQPWQAINPAGVKSTGNLPSFISPHQPVKDLREFKHQVTDGLWANIRFEGEIFEMEDQRNWTDASFKTYCTPLEIPYPVQVSKGDKIFQRISLSVDGDIEKFKSRNKLNDVRLTAGQQTTKIPQLGLQVSNEIASLSNSQYDRLKALNLSHLHIDLTPANKDFSEKLQQAAKQANTLGLPLHVGLIVSENPAEQLTALAEKLKTVEAPITTWIVRDVDDKLFQLTNDLILQHDHKALVGISQGQNFVDLNRARPAIPQIRAASYAINPQIHAIDNASIIESLPIQGDTVRSAQQFLGNRRLIVGPITFKPQPISQVPLPGELPSNVDVRQPSLLTAGWTLGSIKFLAEANAETATYYETVGWKGIMEADPIPERPAKFPSHAGEAFAVYHVFRIVADFFDGEVLELKSSNTLRVVGTVLKKGQQQRILLANLTEDDQAVSISGLEYSKKWVLDSQSLSAANADPEKFHHQPGIAVKESKQLILSPHSILRLE